MSIPDDGIAIPAAVEVEEDIAFARRGGQLNFMQCGIREWTAGNHSRRHLKTKFLALRVNGLSGRRRCGEKSFPTVEDCGVPEEGDDGFAFEGPVCSVCGGRDCGEGKEGGEDC